MICVYDVGNEDFTKNGNAVLCPTECKTKHIAGGEYSFTMTHPLDPEGKWKHLKREAIVKLPVQKETISTSYTGIEAWVYSADGEVVIRETASEPTTINYTAWINVEKAVGVKCTYNSRNWQCVYWDETSRQAMYPPSSSNSWWKEIARMTNGGKALATIPSGTDVYWVEGAYADAWWKVSTMYGITGWCKQSQLTNERHLTPSENQPRVITDQLFRIKSVDINRSNNTVEVYGTHVSNDLAGILVKDVVIINANPALALGKIVDGLMMTYRGAISTDLSGDATYTGSIKWKNGIYCILDKDSGIVPSFNAMFTVDNWDLFVMKQTNPDRGYRIRYGKNVNGINWQVKSEGLVTRVVPVAKDEGGGDLYLPEVWVDSEEDYPVTYMEKLTVKGQVGKAKDDSGDDNNVWTEADLLDEMRAKAAERFSIDQADQTVTEITVQLEPLENTAEYENYRDLMKVLLYDTVKVQDPEIGLDAALIVSELEYDTIRKKVTGVKLTNSLNSVSRSVTGYNVSNASIGTEKLTAEAISDISSQAVDAAVRDAKQQENAAVNVIDNLTSTSTTSALSANQGKVLKGSIDDTNTNLKDLLAKVIINYTGAYSNTSTYSVGQIVSYSGDLWECSTAITTAEDWNSEHWTKLT